MGTKVRKIRSALSSICVLNERKHWMKNEISSVGNLIKIIEDSRNNALKKANEELIRMYWSVGEYLSKEAENAAFGYIY